MSASAHTTLTLHLRAKGLPKPQHEYRFHPKRLWRFDVCWPEQRLAVEVHGGVFSHGRHTRGAGFTRDREKINAAVEIGWSVLEFTTEMVENGTAIRQIERILAAREVASRTLLAAGSEEVGRRVLGVDRHVLR